MTTEITIEQVRELLVGMFLLAVAATVDFFIPVSVQTVLLYLFPLAFVALKVRIRLCFAAVLWAVICWWLSSYLSNSPDVSQGVRAWNGFSRFLIFSTFVTLIHYYTAQLQEKEFAMRKLRTAKLEGNPAMGLRRVCESCGNVESHRGDWVPVMTWLSRDCKVSWATSSCPECQEELPSVSTPPEFSSGTSLPPRPLLSICIPTRNRSSEIFQLLKSIEGQQLEGVEVVISDNSDDDATWRAIDEAAIRIPALKYSRQESVVGFGENLLTCVAGSSGGHVWLMGDDDLVAPGAVGRVLHELSLSPECYLLANFSAWNEDFSRRLIPSLFPCLEDEVSLSGLDGLHGINLGVITFLGAHIAPNKQDFRALLAQNIRSNYPHVIAFAEFAAREIRTISDPLIMQRYQTSRRWDLMALYTLDYPEVFRALRRGGKSRLGMWSWKRNLVLKEISRGIAGDRVRDRPLGPKQIAELLLVYGNTPEFWLIALPSLLLPKSVLLFLKKRFGYFG
jgi:glycosyltransferase involved in cell wall biosynthesis